VAPAVARRAGRVLVPLLIILAVAGILWWSRFAILGWMGTRLVVSEAPEKADAALVLAGGLDGERILAGGKLVQDGYAPVALFSGVHSNYDTNECDWALPYAGRHGYPASLFVCVPNHGRSTREEAQYLIAELRRRQAKHVLLVTSHYHSGRAAWLYRQMAPDIRFTVIAAETPDFRPERWWESREGRKLWFFESIKSITERVGM
jgi:uncharacterized SAM-binding protein YcdF (DUF218 family)